ncbi:hypothetical protein [Schumannella sp. 10F1B-5-1]|uniref:hypothetical protein n=1 Tax=Schumannella sp. 10F1B-5-1 TaxID=2590780 RepID=UPI0011325452|nr:hypothetical protein [Schumannella sp. 10F1B-5-1]TPW76886.1 hypothetical protein FJ658_02860 [Schumannella sp. 10F1B-5-1]
MIVFVLLAVYRGRGLARDATGTRMRRRHAVAYAAAGQEVVDDILARFASGDPANYAPMPAGIGRNGTLRVQIWTADADRLGFVAISAGIRHSELVVLDGLAYDRLSAVLDRGISRPDAAAATPAG